MAKFARHTSRLHWFDGVPVIVPNKIDEVETGSPHWYISFNSSVRDYGCQTTALVLGQMEYFLILRGDHREGFSNAIKNTDFPARTRLGACLQYVRDNRAELHEFSESII